MRTIYTCPYCGHPVYANRQHITMIPVIGRCGQLNCRKRMKMVGGVYVKLEVRK